MQVLTEQEELDICFANERMKQILNSLIVPKGTEPEKLSDSVNCDMSAKAFRHFEASL